VKPTRLPFALTAVLLLGACGGNPARDPSLQPGQSPADLYVALSAEYYRRGDMETALLNAQKGLEKDDSNPRVHNVLATIYQQLDRKELAEKHFQTALRLDPSDSFTHTAWGNFLCEQKRYSEAQAEFRKALDNPLFNSPWLALGSAGACARSAGDPRQAEDYLHQALTANPRYSPALLEMAEIDYAAGRYKSARGYLERYFQARGYSPKALLLAARVERKLGATKRARAYEQTLRKTYPDAPEVIYLNET
jgi:type IV pilus assembly protein PilF